MVRGCEKRIYYVKNPESEIFDEAYLVLRRQNGTRAATPREIELEAMRIVSSATGEKPSDPVTKKSERIRAFLAGAALSATFIGISSLLLWLII